MIYRALFVFGFLASHAFCLATEIGVTCVDAKPKGARVVRIVEGSYAQQMEILVDDVILMIDSKLIDSATTLAKELARREAPTIIWKREQKYYRGGLQKRVQTNQTYLDNQAINRQTYSINTVTYSPPERVDLGFESTDHAKGVFVNKLDQGGLADSLGMMVGDILFRINDNAIDDSASINIYQDVGGSFDAVYWLRGNVPWVALTYPSNGFKDGGEKERRVISGRPIDQILGFKWTLTDQNQWQVDSVTDESWADSIGLRIGDILVRADNSSMADNPGNSLLVFEAIPYPQIFWKRGTKIYTSKSYFLMVEMDEKLAARYGSFYSGEIVPTISGIQVVEKDGSVLVESVSPTGNAAKLGMTTGDVVITINGLPVTSKSDFEREQSLFETGGVVFRRGGTEYLGEVKFSGADFITPSPLLQHYDFTTTVTHR